MLRSLGLLFVFGPALLAQSPLDDAHALAAFQREFRPARKDHPVPIVARQQALARLDGLDSPKVAAALVDAWLALAGEIDQVDGQRSAWNEEVRHIEKGQEGKEQRTFESRVLDRWKELQRLIAAARTEVDALRELELGLAEHVQKLQRKDTCLCLLQKVCCNRQDPLRLKLAAARAVGNDAVDLIEEITAALARAKEPADQIALLDAMTMAGKVAVLHATPALQLLDSPDEAVAERAALALVKIALPDAIEPMIRLMMRSKGQMQMRVASALEVLTGQQFGAQGSAWLAWWKAEGADYGAGRKPLGQGIPSHRKNTDRNYYFGIPQEDSSAILYVLDCSGSMKREVDFKTPGSEKTGKQSRLDACKAELIRALHRLQPTQRFAVLWFNDQPHLLQTKTEPATKAVVDRVAAQVAELQPASSTDIYDSMEMAFQVIGRGAYDKHYGVALDTIFLLTDGSPTLPDKQPDSTDKILEAVRSWNALHRVTIHAIGIGRDINQGFLRQLAKENGGELKVL
jgi:Mg-chelatase subunit ChlD